MLAKRNSFRACDSPNTTKYFTLMLANTSNNNNEDQDGGGSHSISDKVFVKKGKSVYDCIENILLKHNMSPETHTLHQSDSATAPPISYGNGSCMYQDQTLYIRRKEKREGVTRNNSDRRNVEKNECDKSPLIPFSRARNESKKMAFSLLTIDYRYIFPALSVN